MYTSVLVLVLIGQGVRGQEKGTIGAAIAEEQGRNNANLGVPSAKAKPVGERNLIRLDTIPTIEGMSSDMLKTGEWGRWPADFHVIQIHSKNEMLVTYYFNANIRLLKMRGFPTKGLANGDEFTLLSLAKVTGTSTYRTVGGASNTVHVIEPLSDSELEALAVQEKREEQDRQTAKRLAKIAANRTWKVKGRSQQAKLTGITDEGVELTGTNRKKAIYALDDLSKLDQDYLKSVHEKLDAKTKEDERDKKRRDKANDDHVVYLSDLKESSVDVWVYIPGFGFGKDGKFFVGDGKYAKIVLDGKESPKGIFAHPKANGTSKVVYDLKGVKQKRFQATVGVADERRHGPYTPLTFEVWGDGKRLWQSKPVKLWGQPQECDVKLPEISKLELRVECPGDASFAYAVWVEPRLADE